jgi:hypothetical protein
MTALKERTGILLFCLIAIIVLICAFMAYQVTGPVGIEERFHNAAGLTPDEEAGANGNIGGFSLEGNGLLYLFVILLLAVACILIFRRYRW